jgi:hypothetical protein
MFSYSPREVYRCCQHNVSHGWPYFAEELWLATSDGGLCASLYAPSEATAKVAGGKEVKIVEETDYPFSDSIVLKISKSGSQVRFPLSLRVPAWCDKPELSINGQASEAPAASGAYLVVDRAWTGGDTLRLRLPMKVSLRRWAKNHDSVSVDYGPLTYSLQIGERWSRYGGNDKWPDQEVFPTTPWNYGLVLDTKDPESSFELIRSAGPLAKQPFAADAVPLRMKAKARRIPNWKQDPTGLLRPLGPSPVKSNEPVETITLVPMGAARLRIASFPVIGDGPDAHEWPAPTK